MIIKNLIFFLFLLPGLIIAQLVNDDQYENLLRYYYENGIRVSEINKNILKLEYPRYGKIRYININDISNSINNVDQVNYSKYFDSTLIDLRFIDTTLYNQMYYYWQTVPLVNYLLLIGDINNNGYPEIYGLNENDQFNNPGISAYELNSMGKFIRVYSYNLETYGAKAIYDVDKDNSNELLLVRKFLDTINPGNRYISFGRDNQGNLTQRYLYFRKANDTSLATSLFFEFRPIIDSNSQQNDIHFGDWDGDNYTDQILIYPLGEPQIAFYEFSPIIQNFRRIFPYYYLNTDLYFSGFAIGDFDQDGKTEFLAGSVHGKIIAFENCGNNCYQKIWEGRIETFNAYMCAQTNDIDGNGKKEIWIGGYAFYYGKPLVRIYIFEAVGDNNYQLVYRIDLVITNFPWDTSTIQIIDVDKDGKEEILLCFDSDIIILKFNGNINHHSYLIYYYRKNTENTPYYDAKLFNLIDNDRDELLIQYEHFCKIYKPNISFGSKDEYKISDYDYKIYPAYPNPFNLQTTIKFELTKKYLVLIKIFNSLGKEITKLLEKELTPGYYEIKWEARDNYGDILPSGVYFIQFQLFDMVNYNSNTIKVMLIK